jgi:hypothetical protein
MADKKFGVKQIDLIGASGTPTLASPNNLNIEAIEVSINNDLSISGIVTTNQLGVSGISTFSADVKVGINTSVGLVLTSPNGTQYRLIVDNSGTLSTVTV